MPRPRRGSAMCTPGVRVTSSCGTTARPCIVVDHGQPTRRGSWCARRSPRLRRTGLRPSAHHHGRPRNKHSSRSDENDQRGSLTSRESGRPASHAADEIQDCQGTRPRNSANATRPRRRGDRVNHCNQWQQSGGARCRDASARADAKPRRLHSRSRTRIVQVAFRRDTAVLRWIRLAHFLRTQDQAPGMWEPDRWGPIDGLPTYAQVLKKQ